MINRFRAAVIETIEEIVADLTMTDDRMESTLGDLGIDSLDTMLVLIKIQEKTGIEIPEDEADNLNTPDKIIEYLDRKS